MFIAGDSAGANITHNMAMQLEANGVPKVEGVALLCPYFFGSTPIDKESIEDWKNWKVMWSFVMPSDMTLDDPRINPVADGAPILDGLGWVAGRWWCTLRGRIRCGGGGLYI